MRKQSLIALCLASLLAFSVNTHAKQFNVLLYTQMDGFHHQSVQEGIAAMRQLAEKHYFGLDWQNNTARAFTDESLARYDAIVFLHTTGNVLNDEQKAAMKRFIQAGNGFVGIHSASDTEYDWEWYTKLVGRMFHIHPPNQTAQLKVLDSNFPGMERMPERFWFTDEYYEFGPEKVDTLNYILAVDGSTFDPYAKWGEKESQDMDFRPLAWYHEYDGGRSFYTALGHIPATFSDILLQEHIYGGLYWAATGKGLSD